MRYGNCWLGLAIILVSGPGRGRLVRKRSGYLPHLLWRMSNWMLHHYRLKRDVLPAPWNRLLYEGEFDVKRGR